MFVPKNDTVILLRVLRDIAPGETITWEKLGEAIGRPCRPGADAYGLLGSARRMALNQHDMVFVAERGKGLRRCSDDEKVDVTADYVQQSRRRCSKAMRVSSTVNEKNLTPERLTDMMTSQAQAQVHLNFTTKKSRKKINAVQNGQPRMISFQETLDLFKSE